MPASDQGRLRTAFQDAFELLRTKIVRWDRGVCTLKRGGERFGFDSTPFLSRLEKPVSGYRTQTLALLLADELGLPIDDELVMSDVVLALPVLRPRLLRREVLEGPGRGLVRREIGSHMLLGLSLGPKTQRNFVTTRMLDAWGITFEDALAASTDELVRRFDAADIEPLEEDPRVLALRHPREPASAMALGVDRLVEGLDEWPGTLIGTPARDTLLIVPLDERSTIKDLGTLVDASYRLAGAHPEPLSPAPCWLYEGRLHALGLRMEEEGEGAEGATAGGGSRRATIETNNPEAAHLLRVLMGEASGPPDGEGDPDDGGGDGNDALD